VRAEIESGKYKPGERLPSMDVLADTYAVNKITVRKALADLNAAGLIYSVPAQGTFVADPTQTRPLIKRSVTTVGLISYIMVPGNTGLYHMEIINGMRDELSKVQANLVISPVRDVVPQSRILDQIAQVGMDAVVYLGAFEPASLRRMIQAGPPCVLVDFTIRGERVDTILLDNRGGAIQAMEHLLSLGHRDIAVIMGAADQTATRERLDGVYDALDHAQLPRDSVRLIQGDFQREGGYTAMRELLNSGHVPTAVFCMNDEMAAGALQAIHALSSLNCPADISVIGFDDTAWATTTQPPLTTIQAPKTLMGRLAVQRLLARLQRNEPPMTTLLPTQLIVRESTAPPKTAP
jgi:LacI family repressor for deo operon, udp, cdd, tsx, nupC, and nupG